MGRAPCCDKANVKKGPWSPEEDAKLKEYIEKHGTGGNWISLPQKAGLRRCGKSCRLRWLNYLRPDIKHGEFTDDEDRIISALFATIGSRWSIIAAHLPGRTDNDIKNYWNTKLKKKLITPQHQITKQPHNNNHNPHQVTFSSLLSSSSPSSSSSSPSSPSISHHYTTQPSSTPFTLDPRSDNISNPSSISSFLHPKSQTFSMGPINNSINFEAQLGTSNSCSTSSADELQMGSYQNNYLYNMGVNDQEINQKLMMGNGFWSNGSDQCGSLDWFGLEEINQLISTNSTITCNNNSNDNFLFDDNKTEVGKVMYY